MWVLELFKSLWASYKAGKAANAAADIPAGEQAISSVEADGKTIQAQLEARIKPVQGK